MPTRVWLITGCSSGLGKSLAHAVLDQGDALLATARNPDDLAELAGHDRCETAALDLTNPGQFQPAVNKALDRFGRIDVLVNNAGYAVLGALEELDDQTMERNIETNFIGPLRLIRAVLPIMREQRAGRIINMSAIAAFSNHVGFSSYGGAKAGLDAACEALASEVQPLGITMTSVLPGPLRTGFIGRSMIRPDRTIDAYDRTVRTFGAYLDKIDGKQPGDPEAAANAVLELSQSEKPPSKIFLGRYAIDEAQKKLKRLGREIETWEQLGAGTDFH